MALLDVVQTGEEQVSDLREELDRFRRALDRTDAVLSFADESLERAEVVIASSRRWVPIVIGVFGVAAVGATVYLVMRKRRRSTDDPD
ncbi:MAG: hypothetical protein KGP12_01720 [Actinomycetales bacterium]|nr:hypothetical protein [Actinomycetales bacterium]